MEIAIIFIISMAFAHFMYEGIILPSIRLSIRFKLFALRDELRALMMNDVQASEVFRIQQASINNSIKMLCRADPSLMSRFEQQLKRDASMQKRIEKRMKLIQDYQSDEFQQIVKGTRQSFRAAYIANMGAWFIYIVPIAFAFVCINRAKQAAKELLSVPEGELCKVLDFDTALV